MVKWVLDIIHSGCLIEFTSPHLPKSPSLFMNTSQERLPSQEVDSLLLLGDIELKSSQQQGNRFYSKYFLIPRKKEGWRPILDLRQLNVFILKLRFRIVILASIIPSMYTNDWFTAFDLKDACFRRHPPLSQEISHVHSGHEPLPKEVECSLLASQQCQRYLQR